MGNIAMKLYMSWFLTFLYDTIHRYGWDGWMEFIDGHGFWTMNVVAMTTMNACHATVIVNGDWICLDGDRGYAIDVPAIDDPVRGHPRNSDFYRVCFDHRIHVQTDGHFVSCHFCVVRLFSGK